MASSSPSSSYASAADIDAAISAVIASKYPQKGTKPCADTTTTLLGEGDGNESQPRAPAQGITSNVNVDTNVTGTKTDPEDFLTVPVPIPRMLSGTRFGANKGQGEQPEPDPFRVSSKDIEQLESEMRSKKPKTAIQKRRSQSVDNLIFGSAYAEEEDEFDGARSVTYQRTMSDCVPSPSSDSSYASSSGSNSSGDSSSSPTCEISLLERLIRTHPVWFLPSLQRSGALHLLQGREVGNFIVRSSTQPMTMAVSVKLPGNHVEHYLLRAVDNRIALENSTNTFETVHQLIAHYCTLSDEIPVFLRVPSAIAEATTRQQLRSLALLGQEFWTHSPLLSGSCAKELSSPSDADLSNKNLISSGLGSQSSLSQNSLCGELKKPCRPTTLELSGFVVGNVAVGNSPHVGGNSNNNNSNNGATPPPVPPRWSRSALLTPLSLPSSVQSTPSEIQSTFSEKSGSRLGGKKKKRISGTGGVGKAESIHYKDTEILDLFKGTKTLYDDKASDYEDIWSPQQQYSSKSHTPVGPPRLSTFRPDIIASSLGSDLDTLYKHQQVNTVTGSSNATTPNGNTSSFQQQILLSLSKNNLNNNLVERRKNLSTSAQNNKNNRLSFNGNFLSSQQTQQFEIFSTIKTNKSTSPLLLRGGTEKSTCSTSSSASSGSSRGQGQPQRKTSDSTASSSANSRIKNSLYSEPVDSIAIRRFGNYRHSEPNIRWSQPAMMSLVNVDDEFEENENNAMMNSPMQENVGLGVRMIAGLEGNNKANSANNNTKSKSHHQLSRNSTANVSGNNNNVNTNLAQETCTSSAHNPKAQNVAPSSTATATTTATTASERDKRGLAASSRASHQKTSTCANVDNLCHFRDFKKKARKFSCSGGNMESEDEEEEQDQLPVENNPLTATAAASRTNEKTQATAPSTLSTSSGGSVGKNSGTFVNLTGKPKPAPRKRSLENAADNDKPLSPQDERVKLEVSNNQSWHLDNSWEFVMWEKGEEENNMIQQQRKFPVSLNPLSGSNANMAPIPAQRQAFHKSDEQLNNANAYSLNSSHRFSRYDNLESREECEDDGSQNEGDLSDLERDEKISAPWDSSKWENLLRLVSESTQQLDSLQVSDSENKNMYHDEVFRNKNNRDRDSKVLMDSKHRISKILEVNTNVDKASRAISNVVRDLSEKEYGFFGPTLKSFIQCTIAAKVQDPFKVMRNTRQFISGMKNYLVGVSVESQELRSEIKRQTELLSDCEFLNIDAILEEVLVDMVISPLNTHILGLLQTTYSGSRDDSLRLSKRDGGGENFSTMSTSSGSTQERQKNEGVEKLRKIYFGFEESVSPIKKLDKWNEFVCEVQEMENYSSESFLPLLADMLRQVCSSNLPSHVEYMIGLLPHSLAEQNNYSISLLQSAVAALKSKLDRKGSSTLVSVRVIIPDERNGTLIRKMVPIRETTTTKEVSKMVASKIGIANPCDYVLVRIKNGEEKLCPDGDLVAPFVEDNQTALAYKRVDAKIGWPQKIS